jgi:photosystem II stability/assembly factor-like uncharacterized protein
LRVDEIRSPLWWRGQGEGAPPVVLRLAVLLVALVASRASAQGGWAWLSPQPQGIAVNAVTFVGNQAWLVGAQGSILTTTDLGNTFTAQPSSTTSDLFGVAFLSDGMEGWAVGAAGTIVHTSNGGKSWAAQTSQSSRKLNGVVFTDALHGFAVGDYRTLLVTSDGGQTWGGLDGQILSLNAVTATDSKHIYAVGDSGGIVISSDGGNTFTLVSTPTTNHLLGIVFSDAMHGYAVGAAGTLLVSSDAGATWAQQSLTTSATPPDVVGAVALSTTKLFLIATNGNVYASSDGKVFQGVVVDLPHVGNFTALAADSSGDLFASTDQGQIQLAPTPTYLTPSFADVNTALSRGANAISVSFGSPLVGLVVQGYQLLLTTDGGHTFTAVGPVLGPNDPQPLWQAVHMPTATDAYAVGLSGVYAASHDAGKTWNFVYPPGLVEDLLAVFFVDASNGIAVGAQGVVVTTHDGASTFNVQYPTSITLNAVAMFDPYHGVIAGQYGFILYTVDGTTWVITAPLNGVSNVLGAAVVAPDTVYLVGQSGLFAASHDQGQTFSTLASPSVSDLTAVTFRDRQNGYITTSDATTSSGSILVTRDGAQSFSTQFAGSSLLALSFGDALHGFASGAEGALVTTKTAGEPSCVTAADCPVDPKGVLGYVCTGGACVPCNTNDSCTAACTACVAPNQFCYTGYCGNCVTNGGCIAPAQCVLGVCQNAPPPYDGGMDGGPDAGPDAGPPHDAGIPDAGGLDGGDGGDGGSTSDGGSAGGCGCASNPGGAAEIALLALILIAIFSPRRHREG